MSPDSLTVGGTVQDPNGVSYKKSTTETRTRKLQVPRVRSTGNMVAEHYLYYLRVFENISFQEGSQHYYYYYDIMLLLL